MAKDKNSNKIQAKVRKIQKIQLFVSKRRLILLADIITAERLVKSMLNKYIFLPYISERKFRQILECFCADICVSKIAVLCKVSRPCVNRIVQQAFDSQRMRKNQQNEVSLENER